MRRIDHVAALVLLAAALAVPCRSGFSRELQPTTGATSTPPIPQAAEPHDEAAEPPPFLGGFLKETRIVYPLRLAGWHAQGEQLFDEAAYGASVRYLQDKRSDRWIDVYFYPAGNLPAEAFEANARGTAAEIETAIVGSNGRDGFAIDPLSAFDIVVDPGGDIDDSGSRPARSLGLGFVKQGVAYHSAMALTVHDLYFIKVRHTVEARSATRGEARKAAEDFLAGLVRATRIVSTGNCWMPLPLTRLPTGSAPPTDAHGTLDVDGKVGAYVYPDHIAAYDPDSPAARIAMILVMREHGQWFPGCESPERMNPEVGHDKREIRLEYRLPSDGSGDGSRRLRGRRVGVG